MTHRKTRPTFTTIATSASAIALLLGVGMVNATVSSPPAMAADGRDHAGGKGAGAGAGGSVLHARGKTGSGGHSSGEDAILHDDHDVSHDDHDAGTHDSGDDSGAVHLAQTGRGQGQAGGGAGAGAGQGGVGARQGGMGQGGRSVEDAIVHGEEEEDSDRPEWAGTQGREGKPGRSNPEPGVDKGDEYGDLYVILRDEDGVPILNEDGYVQPVDADGNPIPLNEEGEVDEAYVDLLQEADFGRMNVGRAPTTVLLSRLEEALLNLDAASSITTDASGRITYVGADGETYTIDAPLENLALYVDLMQDGVIDGAIGEEVVGTDISASLYTTLNNLASDDTVAATLFAAAADKTSTVTIDQVVYMNTILDVFGTDPIVGADGELYFDFSSYDYNRSSTWDGVTMTLLQQTDDGSFVATEVDLYDAVFGGVDADAEQIAGFTLAADDALQVIEYVHEMEVPEDPTTIDASALTSD